MIVNRRSTILLLVLLLGCGVSSWGLARIWPPTFRTHRDTVAFALDRHGVHYATIAFEQSYEESANLRSFSAGVRVLLDTGDVVRGWIGCEQGQRQCFLELRALGIRGTRLPDLTRDGDVWDWQSWRDWLRRWVPV